MILATNERRFFSLAEMVRRKSPNADTETLALDCELVGLKLKKIGSDWFVNERDQRRCETIIEQHALAKEPAHLLATVGFIGLLVTVFLSLSVFSHSVIYKNLVDGLEVSQQLASP